MCHMTLRLNYISMKFKDIVGIYSLGLPGINLHFQACQLSDLILSLNRELIITFQSVIWSVSLSDTNMYQYSAIVSSNGIMSKWRKLNHWSIQIVYKLLDFADDLLRRVKFSSIYIFRGVHVFFHFSIITKLLQSASK